MKAAGSRRRQWWAVIAMLLAAALATATLSAMTDTSSAAAPEVSGAGQDPAGKVTICHRTNSIANPYSQTTVNVSAVDGSGNGDHYYRQHTGPVWNPTMVQGDTWGDIIPPISGVHDGLNWNRPGKLIWRLGCQKPVIPTPTPSPTDTGTPTPTPTGSTPSPTDTVTPTPSPSPSPTDTGTPSPTQTGTPTPSPSPTVSPTPGRPAVPCVILARAAKKLPPRKRITLLKEASCAGEVTIKAQCRVNGQKTSKDCTALVRNGQVRGSISCSTASASIRVRVVATRSGFTAQRYSRTWRVNRSAGVVCEGSGKG